jgi:chromodomain-helicase-DNA-binding protein 7
MRRSGRSDTKRRKVYNDDSDDAEFFASSDSGEDEAKKPKRGRKKAARKAEKGVPGKADEVEAPKGPGIEIIIRKRFTEAGEVEYFVKYKEKAYIHCGWVQYSSLDLRDIHLNTRVKRFEASYDEEEATLAGDNGTFESYCTVERFVAHKVRAGSKQYLVKWMSLPYDEATWEDEEEPSFAAVLAQASEQLATYDMWQRVPTAEELEVKPKPSRKMAMEEIELEFSEGHELRSYQLEGVRPNLHAVCIRVPVVCRLLLTMCLATRCAGCFTAGRRTRGASWRCAARGERAVLWSNCGARLQDEMGLGKTVQSVSFCESLRAQYNMRGPFLVVAPLSTIPHWHREFLEWTSMNAIVYHGSSEARELIRKHEFRYASPQKDKGGAKFYEALNNETCRDIGVKLNVDPSKIVAMNKSTYAGLNLKAKLRAGTKLEVPVAEINTLDTSNKKSNKLYKFNVLITTYETILADATYLQGLPWNALVVDEAHRLKNAQCSLAVALRKFKHQHIVLLTGTPLQNTTAELWSLLNFVDSKNFADAWEFDKTFGDVKNAKQVDQLKTALRPYLLRRMKEDVEKNLAAKEETIIEVELTDTQKKYYRAILDKNFGVLKKGAAKASNLGSLMNIVMELRKCCNHPFLINGVEDAEREGRAMETEEQEHRLLVETSGKLVLLDKLLPKLRDQGHKVLIFSQMTRVLDVLEDYLEHKSYKYERLDGGIRGAERQSAIDRYTDSKFGRFVFLLCTRAGGQGINLTAADTVIIFDSDWNPQNDIQAMARCHRIGQTKAVQIYRLLTRNTYERRMFDRASQKLGLDQAVLTTVGETGGEESAVAKAESVRRVDELLRVGAYDLFSEENETSAQQFCEEDIDQILQRRTTTIQHDTAQNVSNPFSKASFSASTSSNMDVNDPDFWDKLLPEAADQPDPLLQTKPRERKAVRRFGDQLDFENLDEEDENILDSLSESSSEEEEDDEEKGKRPWTKSERRRLQRGLLAFGFGRWAAIKEVAKLGRRTVEDIEWFACGFIMQCDRALKQLAEAEARRCGEKTEAASAASPRPGRRAAASGWTVVELISAISGRAKVTEKPEVRGKDADATTEDTKAEDAAESDAAVKEEVKEEAKEEVKKEPEEPELPPRAGTPPLPPDEEEITLAWEVEEVLTEAEFLEYVARNGKSYLQRLERLVHTAIVLDEIVAAPAMLTDSATLNQSVPPATWWMVPEDDVHLLTGIQEHGLGNYEAIRSDPKLRFSTLTFTAVSTTRGGKVEEKEAEEELEKTGNSAKGKKAVAAAAAAAAAVAAAAAAAEEEELDWPLARDMNKRFKQVLGCVARQLKQREAVAAKAAAKAAAEANRKAERKEREAAKELLQETKRIKRLELAQEWSKREKGEFQRALLLLGEPSVDLHTDTAPAVEGGIKTEAELEGGEMPAAEKRWHQLREMSGKGLRRKTLRALDDHFQVFMKGCRVAIAEDAAATAKPPLKTPAPDAPAGGDANEEEGEIKPEAAVKAEGGGKAEEGAAAAGAEPKVEEQKNVVLAGKPTGKGETVVPLMVAKRVVERVALLNICRKHAGKGSEPLGGQLAQALAKRASRNERLPGWWKGAHDR